MYKSAIVHYKNKYPGGLVLADEHSLNVYCSRGIHRVAMAKNGHGQWVDVSEERGCKEQHCLAPIPKNARVHKLYASGKIALSEEAPQRLEAARAMAVDARVPSIAEFELLGANFDDKKNLMGAETKKLPPKPFEEVMKDAQNAVVPDVIDVSSQAMAGDRQASAEVK